VCLSLRLIGQFSNLTEDWALFLDSTLSCSGFDAAEIDRDLIAERYKRMW